MSSNLLSFICPAILLAISHSALAQDTLRAVIAPVTAEQVMETARRAYSVRKPKPQPCPDADTGGDVIVVCRKIEDPDQFMTGNPPSAGMDKAASGAPRAPDVSGLAPCNGACMGFGKVPPRPYIINLDAIPEALTPEEARAIRTVPPETTG